MVHLVYQMKQWHSFTKMSSIFANEPIHWIFHSEILNCLWLADDESDAGDQNDADVDMVEKEVPLTVCTKPFVVKKFHDALRRVDCIQYR